MMAGVRLNRSKIGPIFFGKNRKTEKVQIWPKWSSTPAESVLKLKLGTPIYKGKPQIMAGKGLNIKKIDRKIFGFWAFRDSRFWAEMANFE